MARRPIVLVSCNRIDYEGTAAHIVRNTYIRALRDVVDCMPLLIPATPEVFDFESVASRIDGILLTGSPSHVCPTHYGAEQEFDDDDLDMHRDETTLPMINAAVKMDMPIFAICRGFQELNVVCGGSLHQFIHKLPGKSDHRSKKDITLMENYRLTAHKVNVQKGGRFEKWGLPNQFSVNSLHTQGVNVLGKDLIVEALSEDGVVEAVSMPNKRFIMGTQWHPEGDFDINPPCRRLFEEFGKVLHQGV